jgi:hypothetical protein
MLEGGIHAFAFGAADAEPRRSRSPVRHSLPDFNGNGLRFFLRQIEIVGNGQREL